MLDGIAAFRDAYKNNPKFAAAIRQADALEQTAEKLVPGAYDKNADAADAPPKTLHGAAKAVKEHFAGLRAAKESGNAGVESAVDRQQIAGGKP
jgi:hypothetical protein